MIGRLCYLQTHEVLNLLLKHHNSVLQLNIATGRVSGDRETREGISQR